MTGNLQSPFLPFEQAQLQFKCVNWSEKGNCHYWEKQKTFVLQVGQLYQSVNLSSPGLTFLFLKEFESVDDQPEVNS